MRRLIWNVHAFMIVCILACSVIPSAKAANGIVTFRGFSESFSFHPGSSYTSTDLFPNFKDVMPGDLLTESIIVRNHGLRSDTVKLYLQILSHDEKNPISYSEAYEEADGKDQSAIPLQRDETLVSMADFLSQLKLSVFHDEALICENALSDYIDAQKPIYLGMLERYQTLDLKLELEVPTELNNRYANRIGETDWIFTAEVFENSIDPELPKTGDWILPIAVIMGLSGVLFLLILLTGKRKE